MTTAYPEWQYYPAASPPPAWVAPLVDTFAQCRSSLDSRTHTGVQSDVALRELRGPLEGIGYEVESGKKAEQKIVRPVLFGTQGKPSVSYEVDAYQPEHRVVLEVEAGRGVHGGADYRNLVRACLMADADYLAAAQMLRYTSGHSKPYEVVARRLEAVYASDRLELPLKGVLLIGY